MAEKMGILGRKIGMTRIFAHDGTTVPVTVIKAGPCPITQVKSVEKDGYSAIQIAFDSVKEKALSKPEIGHTAKAGKGCFRMLREIRLAGPAELSVGQDVTVDVFAPGDTVKVSGTTIGKGFQGVMRRWNFHGTRASHGNEKVPRSGGSIGNNTLPGHVFKGKKMAGHWGNESATEMNLQVVDVRPDDNIILIKGSVPGPRNGLVLVRKQ